VLLRLKEDYDGAEPSAGSVSVWNLLSLAHLSDGEKASGYMDQIERVLRRVPASAQLARVVPMMMAAASMYRTGLTQVVLVGPKDGPETAALHRVWLERYVPAAVSIIVEPGEHHATVAERLPWLASMQGMGGRATAYLCRDFACQHPVTDPEAFRVQLASFTRTEAS